LKQTPGSVFGVCLMRTARIVAALGLLSAVALAVPIRYTVNVTFNDGGTANGTFTFDADAGTACSTGSSPCGVYSNVNITTTPGTTRTTGATYTLVCGTNVATCTGVSPDSTEVLFLTTNTANETGLPGLALFFTPAGPLPPAGLSDAGTAVDLSNAVPGQGGQEGSCLDAVCSIPAAPARITNAGAANEAPAGTIPTLSEWGMIVLAMSFIGYAALKMRSVSA
jgi:hypothetical protein